MGDAQSAQREGQQDAAAEEEGGKVEDVQTEPTIDDKPLKTNGQISELNGKADSSLAALNGNCEDDIPAVVLSPDEDTPEKPKEEETPLKSKDIDQKEVPDEAHADEADITEMEAKQNDINESFKKFFSNIGLKLTVKRGSTDKVPEEEPDESAENIKDEISLENTEPETHLNTAQEAHDSDSPTYQTLIDITCEEFIEKEEEKTADTKEEGTSDDADVGTSSPVSEDAHQGATSEEEPQQTSPSSPDTNEIATQFKKFFTSGIFSGLRKKKKSEEEEATEKELVDMVERTTAETMDQQQDEEEILSGVPATAGELEENDLKGDNLPAGPAQTTDEAKSPRTTELVQASPLKKLLSGSSVKKPSKKQKGRKSSDAKLSNSTENISDQLLSSTESTGNQKEEAQPSTDTAEEGAWASFIKLMTPQKRSKRPSVDQGEVQTPGPADGAKPGKAEQISDRSTEEGRKRKDSSVSWEAVLCGSGRRRSHKTSDSEEDNEENKQDMEPKEAPLGTSNEVHEVAPEDNEGSTWKSFKKLVTPKRKVSQDESKDTPSDSEAAQDDSSFSIKKFLSGRKKRKSVEKPEQVYLDEADKEAASDDEDSETPAVVPLSEFDAPEAKVQTQADVESYVPKQEEDELQQNVPDEIGEPVRSGDGLPTEEEEIQERKEALDDSEGPTIPAAEEEEEEVVDPTSKHQQLSDIPEEGAITDTTPGSVTEVAARDDTIAEDLIEITSEAITAPEPVDVTLADETEMVSAVSQLSESSKTSGNATPVPAEYNVMTTELLLQQVSETIAESPKSVPVCSEERSAERLVCSVSHQVLESSVMDQPKILEVHRRLDIPVLETGLSFQAIDAVHEVAAEAQTETASHLYEAISTELVSEAPTEEIDVAEPAADEVPKVDVSELQESINELRTPDESLQVEEPVLEVRETPSAESIPEEEEEEEEVSPTDEAVIDQGEKEISKTDSQGDSIPMLAVETEEAALKEEVHILAGKEAETSENATEQVLTVGPTAVVDRSEEPTAGETAALDSVESKVQQLEVPPSEDNSTPETDMDEPKQTAEHLSEVIDEPENKEPETDAVKIDDAEVTEAEALEVERAGTLESEEGTVEFTDVQPPEMDKDELKQTGEHLVEVTDEQQTHTVKIDAKDTDLPEDEKVDTFDSEDDVARSLDNNVPSPEDVPTHKMDIDELKQTDEHLAEVTGELEKKEPEPDASTTEDLEVDREGTSELGEGAVESLIVPSPEDVPPSEMDKDELKQTDVVHTEVSDEPQTDAVEVDDAKDEEEPEVEEEATLESGKIATQSTDKVPSPEDVPSSEIDKDESQEDAAKETEVPELEQRQTLESEESNIQSFEDKVPSPEDVPVHEIGKDELKQTDVVRTEVSDEPKTDAVEADDAKDAEEPEAEQAATLESGKIATQSTDKVPSPEDVPVHEIDKDELKHTTEYFTEESQEDAAKDTEEPELEQGQTESGESKIQFFEDKVPSLEDTPPPKIDADEPKQIDQVSEITEEPENMEPTAEVSETDCLDDTEDVQIAALESEDSRVQAVEKVASEDALPTTTETVEQVPEEEAEPLNDADVEPDDAPKTVQVQEPPAAVSGTLDSESFEVVTEETPAVEAAPGEAEKTAEVDAEGEKPPVEPELLPDVKDETEAEPSKTPAAQEVEKSDAQDLGREIVPEDVPQPEEMDLKAPAQPDQALEMIEVEEKESLPCDADVRHEETTAEAAEELEALTALHVSSLSEELSNVQVLQKTVCTEETSEFCVDSAEVSDEPTHEVSLCGVEESVQGEKVGDHPGVEVKAASGHNVVAHVVTRSLRDVSLEKPKVVVHEPAVDRTVGEMGFCGQVETVAHLVQEDINEIADTGSMVVMMHVPSVEFEEHQRVQVQLMDVDVRAAESNFDTVIEVGVTQTKEVIDVCYETIQKVENLSAAPALEEVCSEGIKVTVQEIIQHVQRTETIPESVVVNLERVFTQPDVSEWNEEEQSESIKVEGTVEAPAVTGDGSPAQAEEHASDELKQKSESPESSDALKEIEIDLEKSKIRAQQEESAVAETERPQTTQSQMVTHGNGGLAVPQNTGLISSVGNVESPSSLSLEFKLNIQFGQTKGTAPPSSTTETTVKQAETVEVPATKEVEPEQPRSVVQATQVEEPAVEWHSTQRAVIASQPVLQDVGIQAMEITEPAEQSRCTERVQAVVHAAEVVQSRQKERTSALLRKLALSETKEVFKSVDEESQDQDVWLDAEEDIFVQEASQMSTHEEEEIEEERTERDSEAELVLELEAPRDAEAGNEDNQEVTHNTSTCEGESEGEDFAVAFEDLESTVPAV